MSDEEVISAPKLREQRPPRPTLAIRVQRGTQLGPATREVTIDRGERLRLSLPRRQDGQPRWFLVLPDLSKNYDNAGRPDQADAYRWHGLAAIPYWQIELVAERGRWEIEPFSGTSVTDAVRALGKTLVARGAPRESLRYFCSDAGTFWFAATVESPSGTARTPGAVDSDARGLLPTVLRVAVREGKDYLGALSAFYNVPGVFGSTNLQASRHLGADCADVLLAALAEWTRQPLGKNTNVQSLTDKLPRIAEIDMRDGVPSRRLRWGADIRPGDFIAVKYDGSRKYGHIGALQRDADEDGVLGPLDTVLHNGPDALHATALGEGAFDGHVLLLRPKKMNPR